MSKIAFTGHRPHKLGGYNPDAPMNQEIIKALQTKIIELAPRTDLFITGMALGVDQWAANLVLDFTRVAPLLAVIPFDDYSSKWPSESRREYNKILMNPRTRVEMLNPGQLYSPKLLMDRNQFMLDQCDTLIAIFTGESGGTKNCVERAVEMNKRIIIYNPTTRMWTEREPK